MANRGRLLLGERLAGAPGLRVVSDVHGWRAPFAAVVEQARNAGLHSLQLGDLVEKGPDPAGCLREVADGIEGGWLTWIPGNHDVAVLRDLLRGRAVEGERKETIDALRSAPDGARTVERLMRLAAHIPLWQAVGDHGFGHAAVDVAMLRMAVAGTVPTLDDAVAGRLSRAAALALYGETDGTLDARGLPVRTYGWIAGLPPWAVVHVGHDVRVEGAVAVSESANGARVVHLDSGAWRRGGVEALDIPAEELIRARCADGMLLPSGAVAKLWSPGALAVHAALAVEGGSARLVGGAVRDVLAGGRLKDRDMATDLEPHRVAAALRAAGLKPIPTGLDHGTITVVAGGEPIEVTTLRADIAADGRHATVRHVRDWRVDAERRDFTVNSMSVDRKGRLHDPFGGARDLRAAAVRFVGDPRKRIGEDGLRMLRWVRFEGRYGQGQPDPDARAAVMEAAWRIGRVAGERTWGEVRAIAALPRGPEMMALAVDVGLAEPVGLGRAPDLARFALAAARTTEALPRVAALLPDRAAAEAAFARWKPARADRLLMTYLVEHRDAPVRLAELKADMVRGVERKHLVARAATCRVCNGAVGVPDAAGALRDWQVPTPPYRAADLEAYGYERGPALGRAMLRLRDAWIAARYPEDGAALLEGFARADAETAARLAIAGRPRGDHAPGSPAAFASAEGAAWRCGAGAEVPLAAVEGAVERIATAAARVLVVPERASARRSDRSQRGAVR